MEPALMMQTATGLLAVSAAGGLKMLPLPKWLVLVHAGIAICGFLLLVIATWKVSHA